MHSFKHRLRQAWKTAQANAVLLRSPSTSHTKGIKLLQGLVKPSLLYGSETWELHARHPRKNHWSRESFLQMVSQNDKQESTFG